MSTKISKQTVTRILALNNMSNLRSSPMTPMMSRTQVRSRPEGGVAAVFQPGDQIVINLQNKTDYVDTLQSFLKFKVRTVVTDGRPSAVAWMSSALALFSESQVGQKNNLLDHSRFLNQYNYHQLNLMSKNQKEVNYNSMFLANSAETPNEIDQARKRGAIKHDVYTEVMIPLKFLSGIFDNTNLMPPHLARGLRIELTCESVARALTTVDDFDNLSSSYEITDVSILSDTFKIADVILEHINSEYTNKKTGLIYEYYAYNAARSTTNGDTINIEFNKPSSQTINAMVCASASAISQDHRTDSFKSAVLLDTVKSQFQIGAHYLPVAMTEGVVEHYNQYMYYANMVRGNKEMAVEFTRFKGIADVGVDIDDWKYGAGVYAMTLQRSNILEVSGVPLNDQAALYFYAENVSPNCDTYIFVKHMRRVMIFPNRLILDK